MFDDPLHDILGVGFDNVRTDAKNGVHDTGNELFLVPKTFLPIINGIEVRDTPSSRRIMEVS